MTEKNTNSAHEKLEQKISSADKNLQKSFEELQKKMTRNFYLTLLLIFLLGVLAVV